MKLSDNEIRDLVLPFQTIEQVDAPRAEIEKQGGLKQMAPLRQWCDDLNRVQDKVRYGFAYVDEEGFKKYRPADFTGLVDGSTEDQGELSC